jgi:hypothetical protein
MSTGQIAESGPLKPIVDSWLALQEHAQGAKSDRFGKWAIEAMKYFDGATDDLWESPPDAKGPGSLLASGSNSWMPTFRMSYNRLFEGVAIYGPALYFRNPNVQCTPIPLPDIQPETLGIDVQDPQMAMLWQQEQMQSQLLMRYRQGVAGLYQPYLNWVQQVGDKKRQARRAIADALITGAGYLETSLETDPNGQFRYPRSVFVHSSDVLKDPDAVHEEDVQWISVRYCEPVNVVEEKFSLPPGTLKGHMLSYQSESQNSPKGKRGQTAPKPGSYDLIEYRKIYSRNGFGNNLRSRSSDVNKPSGPTAPDLSFLGRNVMVVVAKGVPFPLNLPPELLADPEAAMSAAAWPTPFWLELNRPAAWPLSELRFIDKPGSVWPVSLFKAVAGEMKFINWCMSFLADKAAMACQTIMIRAKEAGGEIQKQLNGASAPYSVLELSNLTGLKPEEVVTFIQAPQFPIDIWKMVAEIDAVIDKRLGLTELLYGMSSRQMRSAAEADLKGEQITVRPDDMANSVEEFISATAQKEAEVAAYHLDGQDVQMVLGGLGAQAWDVFNSNHEPGEIVRSYSFRTEASSTRKPNKNTKVAQIQEFGQYALPVLQQFAMAGNPGPWNAFITAWGEANDADITQFLIDIPQPQEPPPDPAAEADAAKTQQEMQFQHIRMLLDAESHYQEMRQEEEAHKQRMKIEAGKAQSAKAMASAKASAQRKRA